ncbi:MAG: CPBP family intramembrane glutamic endopeptidase [Candidatus Nanopelagicales bacterium]
MAIGVFIAYVVAFIGLSATSGIAYADWFATGDNAFRTAVIPLIGGSLVLIAFVLWARWDFVFRDPARPPWPAFLWVPVVIFVVGIVTHFAIADWANTPADLLLAIVAAGVLVGFTEETLFRGIILRGLRTDLRPEAWVMLISSVWFGFFHLTNLAVGSPVGGVLFQCVQASAAGVVLYVFRRVRGLLLLGMIAHGLWDMSVFLPPPSGTIALLNLAIQILVFVAALSAAIILMRRDRKTAVTSTGLQTL